MPARVRSVPGYNVRVYKMHYTVILCWLFYCIPSYCRPLMHPNLSLINNSSKVVLVNAESPSMNATKERVHNSSSSTDTSNLPPTGVLALTTHRLDQGTTRKGDIKRAEIYKVSTIIFKCTVGLAIAGAVLLVITYILHELLDWYDKLWVHCLEVQHMKEDEEAREKGIRRTKMLKEIVKHRLENMEPADVSYSADGLTSEDTSESSTGVTANHHAPTPKPTQAYPSVSITASPSKEALMQAPAGDDDPFASVRKSCMDLRASVAPTTQPYARASPTSHTASPGSDSLRSSDTI